MQPRPRPPALRLTTLLTCAALAAASGGCGSSRPASPTGPDPARAVPASAPLFAGGIVRPTGSLRERARAAGRALTRQADPYLRLLGALQTPGSPALDFKRDLAPWLGAQAAIFLTPTGPGRHLDPGPALSLLQQGLLGSSPVTFPFASAATPPEQAAGAGAARGAIVLDTTNTSAARAFVNTQAARAGAHPASYRGVAYEATGAGIAFGLAGQFAVIGSEPALRSVIDTLAGGASLASAPSYAKLAALAPAQALAHVYVSGLAGARASASAASASPGLLALLAGSAPANISLLPSAGSIALDADTLPGASPAAAGGLLSPQPGAARALGELPGGSFVAIGLGSAGALRDLAALGRAAGRGGAETPGISIKGLLAGLIAPVGAMTEASGEARRDFQSWMGPGAIFASGTGLADLRAGLVISSRNPALSRASITKLAVKLRRSGGSVQPASIAGTDAALTATLTGLPVPLAIADGRDAMGQTKFVIGLGEASIAAALSPPGTLSAAPSYAAASAALDEGISPALIVQPPTLLSLLESVGLSEDQTIASLVPFLRSLVSVSGGGRSLGSGVERFRLVLALRPG